VIELGSIPIVKRDSIIEARGKACRVCESLSGDPISATRLGTAVSQLTRILLASGSGARMGVGLRAEAGRAELILSFEGSAPLEVPAPVRSFFEEVATSRGESEGSITTAVYPLSVAARVDEPAVSRLRQIVQERSRGELMEELRRKNRELEESFENLKRTRSAKDRMESELNIGREIQMSMLPVDFDAYAHRSEFEVFATLHPAREVGGDFYDFFLIDEDRLCVCVGDVSGKGVPAALFMAMTKTLIKSRATNDFSPASILTHVNDELGRNNESCMFVTVWLGILDVKSGNLVFANAGHNPPFIKRCSGVMERLAQLHGPVVAAVDGLAYGEDEVALEAGDLLLLYTDGVTEAMNEAGDLYGESPLTRSLQGEFGSVREAVSSTVEGVWAFQGEALQADDVTVMATAFMGEHGGAAPESLELEMSNDLGEIAGVIQSFGEFAAERGVDEKARRSVSLALDDLLNNIVSYAYGDEAGHRVGIRIEVTSDRLSVTIEDEGRPFNPFAQDSPDTTLSLQDRSIGGLGIHLVRQLMDEVSYVRRTDRNVVNIVKHLAEEQGEQGGRAERNK
jgi:sigma-B regulation protein RsbU (phosphoserine phosphatase)